MPAVTMNQKIAVGVVFVSAMFMNIMDITIVNVALPTIGRDFGIPPTAVDGIVIAYLVSLAVFIPASGWLGDRFGGKRVLMTAIVVFTARLGRCAAWPRTSPNWCSSGSSRAPGAGCWLRWAWPCSTGSSRRRSASAPPAS